MSYFKFENKNIYYSEIGTGIPLLLLHGNTASSLMFSDIAQKYAEDFKVVLIDFLGHGRSERLKEFPADIWFYEAQQTIAFLKEKGYKNVNIIGSSGGALVAINVALEAPELVSRVIADSFEGEVPLKQFTENIVQERELSKSDENAKKFYQLMHGDDWEHVVDNDTSAIARHTKEIGKFFHKDLCDLRPDILMTGSKQDEFLASVSPDFFEKTYDKMLKKIGHGTMHLFDTGVHPAMLSNVKGFYGLSMGFFDSDRLCIRVATVDDASELLDIYSYYVRNTAITFEYSVPTLIEFKNRIAKTLEKYPYIVVAENNEILGYAYTEPFVGRCAYDWSAKVSVYVREDKRRSGLGRMLYEALENILKVQNIVNINACIAYPEAEDEYLTKDSAHFHRHMGYSPVGEFHKCGFKFGRWYNMIWMEKMLDEHPTNPEPVIPFSEMSLGIIDKCRFE